MDEVKGCPEIMCPRTNYLGDSGTLGPQKSFGSTMSLLWYIPAATHYTIRIGWCITAGMYQSRDIVYLGRFILGTKGPRKFARGHIVTGRPITPPGNLGVGRLTWVGSNPTSLPTKNNAENRWICTGWQLNCFEQWSVAVPMMIKGICEKDRTADWKGGRFDTELQRRSGYGREGMVEGKDPEIYFKRYF